jgi:predicted HD phosphohydrolase
MTSVARFTQMIDGTTEEYLALEALEHEYVAALPDRIIQQLLQLKTGLGGYAVDRLTHSLQSATRALRDGADDELIVGALIHDIGDELSPMNHSEVAAAIIRPYVRPQVTWIIEQHGLFQSYYFNHHYGKDRNGRDRFRDHPWFNDCEQFCFRWDQSSFDPNYPNLSLDDFKPYVERIFRRPAFSHYTQAAAIPLNFK